MMPHTSCLSVDDRKFFLIYSFIADFSIEKRKNFPSREGQVRIVLFGIQSSFMSSSEEYIDLYNSTYSSAMDGAFFLMASQHWWNISPEGV